MKKSGKIADLVFAFIFIVLLILPFILLNRDEVIDSALENRRMTMWPGWGFSKEKNEWFGHFAEDRVGFREEAIRAKADLNYLLFKEFSEDMHMEGKEGYLFPADENYVKNFQRLNIDESLVDDLVTYALNAEDYAEKNDAAFVLFIAPNKSSVLEDKMPDDIHVDESKESLLDTLRGKAGQAGVIPDKELADAPVIDVNGSEFITYNKKFDCAHWNDYGAYLGLRLSDEVIAESYPDIPAMEKADFDLSKKDLSELEFFATDFPIEDEIPVFTARERIEAMDPGEDEMAGNLNLSVLPGNNIAHFHNEDALCDKSIVILHDSFLDDKAEWYAYRYRDVWFASRVNYTFLREYIDKIGPDVVLFEVAERAFADDLSAYDRLADNEMWR